MQLEAVPPAPTERRGRALCIAFMAAAGWMFLYEATKQALLPRLSPWESHWITIAVSAVTAAFVTHITVVRQSRVLRAMADIESRSERLEHQRNALLLSEERYRSLVEASPEAIAVHRDGRLLYVNDSAARLIGADSAFALTGLEITDFVYSADRSLRTSLDRSGERSEYRLIRGDGEVLDVEAASVGITYESEPAIQTVLRDVTAQKHLEARLVHDAFHDPLTGLPNRSLFRDRVNHALVRLARDGTHTGVTALFLDLDDFKSVNDTLGHAAGDRVLAVVGDRLRNVTRAYDTVARLGGDEFAVLLEEVTHEGEVLEIVERIRAAFLQPVRVDGQELIISASVGVAHASTDDEADVLLRNADVAMYDAKEAGKARHAVFEPEMYEAIVRRLQLVSELREASLDPSAAGFTLFYQPIVELSSGSVRGLEALIRWAHPISGFTSPDTFIPLAEQTGMIVPIGRWILREACLQLEQWRLLWAAEGRDPETVPSVSINISGRQLQEAGFVDDVVAALALTLAPSRRVTLEITETVIMQHTEVTLARLQQIKALGVRLAIDDFGTGYSSLSYLQKFPVDILKIDRAFVEGVARGGSDAALARTIIALGQTLGLRTVAEGVEDEAQREQLRNLGCQLGQGYLFARPMPAPKALLWLASSQAHRYRSEVVA